jgi:molybdopterin/thiamine biosynthesis adenylyltransferase
MEAMPAFLREHAEGDLLPWSCQLEAAERYGVTCGQVEETTLELGLLPARYQRNRQAISLSCQLRLFRSRVTVIGCGGLGGYIIEQLARLGVGQIVAIDPDIFEEHNLNRQLLSSTTNLGMAKVEAALRRVNEINPAVTLIPLQQAFSRENGAGLLARSQVVVDALDSIAVRLELADVCTDVGTPLVHGAIAGWYGHVATQFPGDDTLQILYGSWSSGKGIEQNLGNPAFTPAVVAGLEVAETCKLLLGLGTHLRRRKLMIDLLNMETHELPLQKEDGPLP